MQGLLDQLTDDDPTFQATLNPFFVREPFEVQPTAGIVQALSDAATLVLGQRPKMAGQTPWMDSALLAAAGVETVVMGPAGAGAHAQEEWVELESVIQMAQVLAETAIVYCK